MNVNKSIVTVIRRNGWNELLSHLKIISNNILISEPIRSSDNVFMVSFVPKIPPRDLNIQII